jgi:hypothetical protein
MERQTFADQVHTDKEKKTDGVFQKKLTAETTAPTPTGRAEFVCDGFSSCAKSRYK